MSLQHRLKALDELYNCIPRSFKISCDTVFKTFAPPLQSKHKFATFQRRNTVLSIVSSVHGCLSEFGRNRETSKSKDFDGSDA